jgi:hypothetical protein
LSKHLRGTEDLSKLLKEWQRLGNETISHAEKLRNKSESDLSESDLVEMIDHDNSSALFIFDDQGGIMKWSDLRHH